MAFSKRRRAPRHILVPIDASQHSIRAVDWYLQEISKPGDLVHFVHVVEPHISNAAYASAAETMSSFMLQHYEKDHETGNALGEDFLARVRAHGLRGKFTLHFGNRPGEYLCHLAKDQAVDCIVIGSRGCGKVTRTIFGSVSDYVLHHAHRPVTVVPPS